MANYSFKDPGDEIKNGAVIDGGNFFQLVADTEILVGKTLTINGGNWSNVKPQPEWTINGGNWAKSSLCSNVHPDFVPRGLAECNVNCSHVVDVDEVIVNGVIVETIYHYKDAEVI